MLVTKGSPGYRPPRKKSQMIIAGVAILGALWMLSGLLFPSRHGGAEGESSAIDLTGKLTVQPMQAEERQNAITLYGVTEAHRAVSLRAEVEGRIQKIYKKEGERVKTGETILKVDERDRRGQLKKAEALLVQREIEFKAAERLQKQGFQTDVGFAQSRTNLEEARAGLQQARDDLEHTNVRAPFDGVLERVEGEVGDFVNLFTAGTQGGIATVVDLDPIKVTGQIPQQDMPRLSRDKPVFVKIGGNTIEGKLHYVASVADSASRTFRIEVEVPNADYAIQAGGAAEILLPLESVPAYRVTSLVLSLDDAGRVGVKVIEGDSVKFIPVTILEETPEGLWITGLPASITLITQGQAFVSPGLKINPEWIGKKP